MTCKTIREKVEEVLEGISPSTRSWLDQIVALNRKADDAFEKRESLTLTPSELAKVVYLTGKEARRIAPKLFTLWEASKL